MRGIILLLLLTTYIFAWKMEADKITIKNTNSDTITHIDFNQNYDTPPLVFLLMSDTGSDPSAIRVKNITTSGFDVYTVEPQGEDGPHKQVTKIPYIAIEKGEHTMPDGSKIIAKSIDTQKFQSKLISGDSWDSVTLNGINNTPIVLAQIQTANNERTDKNVPDSVSKPWMSVAIDDVTNSGFKIALERSETTDGNINQTETIAYLAIDSGLTPAQHYFASTEYKKIEYETILSDEIVKGWDNSSDGYTINFSKSYDEPIAVVTKNTRNGVDGGWIRRREINDDNIKVVVDEDKANDSERSHIKEKVGVMVFSKPFTANFLEPSSAKMVINEVLYKETTTGTNNDEFVEFYVTDDGDIKGYILSDQDTNYYEFPSCQVNSGDYVIVYTGSGTNSCSGNVKKFYQGKSQYLNNDKDDILLIRPDYDVTTTTQGSNPKTFNGVPQDYIAYGKSGGAIDAPPTSLHNVTPNWDNNYADEIDNASSGLSIALTPNANDSDKAACWEFTSSGNAADNGCNGYLQTRDTDSSTTYTTSQTKNNNGAPNMHITKSSIVVSDPVNNISNPKRVPGAIIRYCFIVDNDGNANADNVKIYDNLKNDNKESLTYKKAGSLIQDASNDCDCLSSNMDESKGSINDRNVTIDIGTLTGVNDTSTSRGCAFIELEIN